MADAPSELQGWKEIAAYLGRSTRAAQRWEAQYALPVRRVGGTVFADRAELDAWKRSPRGQSAAHAPRGADEDESVALQAPPPAATPPAADSRPREQVPLEVAQPASPSRWSAGRRLWLTAATLAGAATVAAGLLLTLGNSTAGWLKRGAALPPAPGWDRAGLDPGPWAASRHDARLSAQGHVRGPADPAAAKLLLDPGGPLIQTDEMIATSHGVVITGTCDGRVIAVRPDGSLAWTAHVDREHNAEAPTGLALGAAGQLAVSTGECPHQLYANVRTQLHLKRIVDGESIFRLRTGAMMAPPAVASTNAVYQFDQYNTLRAVDPLGDLKWTVDLPGFSAATPAQDAEGHLYVATDGSLFGHRSIWAISPAGRILWSAEEGLFVTLAVDARGALYALDAGMDIASRPVGPPRLVSLTPDGRQRWAREFPEWRWAGARDTLALGPSGPVVRTNDALIAISPDGEERWRAAPAPRAPSTPGPILDRDENVYFSAGDEVVSVDRSGRPRWRLPVPQAGRIILAGDGLLAVTSANRRVFLIHDKGVEPRRAETAGAI